MSEIEKDFQLALFRNLLQIEIQQRRQRNEKPTAQHYIDSFPQFAQVIPNEFYESTKSFAFRSLDVTKDLSEHQETSSLGNDQQVEVVASQLGEYQIIRELGRGGFGVVYEARHLHRNTRVALKTLPIGVHERTTGDAERLHRFRREFRALAELNHPNLVGMQSLEVDGSQWFFTMDLIDGTDFIQYARPGNHFDESHLRSVIPQLANGIMALHGSHIVHRDLKPTNVMVDRNGTVQILDFGLVAELEKSDSHSGDNERHFAGTPAYAAPEQFSGEFSRAADWYSFGVILFEALSGKRPFQAETLRNLINLKLTADPPKLVNHGDVPPDLAKLVDGLLIRDPKKGWMH